MGTLRTTAKFVRVRLHKINVSNKVLSEIMLHCGVQQRKMAVICNMAAVDFYYISSISYHFAIINGRYG
jgi:hypothetical protein